MSHHRNNECFDNTQENLFCQSILNGWRYIISSKNVPKSKIIDKKDNKKPNNDLLSYKSSSLCFEKNLLDEKNRTISNLSGRFRIMNNAIEEKNDLMSSQNSEINTVNQKSDQESKKDIIFQEENNERNYSEKTTWTKLKERKNNNGNVIESVILIPGLKKRDNEETITFSNKHWKKNPMNKIEIAEPDHLSKPLKLETENKQKTEAKSNSKNRKEKTNNEKKIEEDSDIDEKTEFRKKK